MKAFIAIKDDEAVATSLAIADEARTSYKSRCEIQPRLQAKNFMTGIPTSAPTQNKPAEISDSGNSLSTIQGGSEQDTLYVKIKGAFIRGAGMLAILLWGFA